MLVLSGLFAIFLALTGDFLPHDARFLGMDADELCAFADCRIVRFMIHDRVAFGGALVAVGTLYLWLVAFPLRKGEGWAWWTLLLSGLVGFASFLAYLGYGYLDSWHGVATLLLLPCFATGMARSRRAIEPAPLRAAFNRPAQWARCGSAPWLGHQGLRLTATGIMGAGLVILVAGMTRVFVPQDLEYMQLQLLDICAISPRLTPLIAHDRAGFGGALAATGLTLMGILWAARPSRLLWQVMVVAGTAGFGFAVVIHWIIGYLSLLHLLPAYTGSCLFVLSLWLTRPGSWQHNPR